MRPVVPEPDLGPLLADLVGGAEVDRGGGVQADPGMAVVVVVLEERASEGPGVGRTEALGEGRAVLEGLETRPRCGGWTALSTTPDRSGEDRTVRVTHPFHP